jgi:hypothetical protein
MTTPRTVRLGRLAVLGTLGILTAVAASPVVGGSGIGAIFNLGKTNTANSTTTLTGKATTRTLQVTNTGNGSALQLTTKSTVAPMKVNSSVVVANLNADLLDGQHSSAFMAAGAHPDAATLNGVASSGFVQPTGQIRVTVPGSAWARYESTDDTSFSNYANATVWSKASLGLALLTTATALPQVMYGRSLALNGVEFCYVATSYAFLDYVEINTSSSTAGPGTSTVQLVDHSMYNDSACHYYQLPSPVTLGAADGAAFYIQVNWPAGPSPFQITRTTFVFSATNTQAVPPAVSVIVGKPVTSATKSLTGASVK